MTTNKPKWWQSWIVYTLAGLLLTLGPYVGSYLLLGPYHSFHITISLRNTITVNSRHFDYDILRIAFGPLGWAEAKVRGVRVSLVSPDHLRADASSSYEPGW